MGDMYETTLGELVKAGFLTLGDGYRTKRTEHGYPGLPILRVADVLDGKIEPAFDDYVSGSFRSAMGDKVSQPYDVILTTKGTVGRVAIIPSDSPEFVYSPQICFFRIKLGSPLTGKYLYYWFKSSFFWSQALQRKGQTDMADYINLADIRSLQIRVPDSSAQHAIVAVLGALDDKIAVNERIVERCDELRALRLLSHVQNAAKIVRGVPLSSMARFVNGRAFTKGASGTGRMVVRIAEINLGPGASTIYNDIEVPDEHLARPGDVLFAWSGSLAVARWFRPEAIINQHIFKVLPGPGIPTWLAFELTKSKLADFKLIAAGKATTMGHIQRRHLDEPVLLPAEQEIGKLDDELGPLWDRALVAEQENLVLAELRDTLLRRLMSGELRVREAEKVVEGVV